MTKSIAVTLLCIASIWPIAASSAEQSRLSDAQVKQAIIAQSIASYRGNCPCPYNRDRAGRACGRRSAYSRPGGASPICFESDVSDDMVTAYRRTHR